MPYQVMARYLPADMPECDRTAAMQQLQRRSRTSSKWPCPEPECGDTSGKCIVYQPEEDPGITHVWCSRCGDGPGRLHLDGWGFMGQAWYVEHRDDGTTPTPRTPRPRRHDEEVPLGDPDRQDAALRAVARRFGLSDAHRALLVERRGYRADEIGPDARFAFASLPADPAARVFVPPTPEEERELLGVFGFAQTERRGTTYAAFLPHVDGAALLEFLVGPDGRWCGLEYAPDEPKVDHKGKPIKRLGPARQTKAGRYGVERPRQDAGTCLVHTEGGHKAKAACDAFEAIATNIQGASCRDNAVAAAQALDPDKRLVHVLALDADKHGGKEERSAVEDMTRAGYTVALARWDGARGNGPDDALRAGASIVTTPCSAPAAADTADAGANNPADAEEVARLRRELEETRRELDICRSTGARLMKRNEELVEYKRSVVEAEERRRGIWALPRQRLDPTGKAVLDVGQRLISSAESRGLVEADGSVRLSVDAVAEGAGVADDAASRRIELLEKLSFWERRYKWAPETVRDPDTGEEVERMVKRLYVLPNHEMLAHPERAMETAEAEGVPERNHGGNRACPECKQQHERKVTKRTTEYTCTGCGAKWAEVWTPKEGETDTATESTNPEYSRNPQDAGNREIPHSPVSASAVSVTPTATPAPSSAPYPQVAGDRKITTLFPQVAGNRKIRPAEDPPQKCPRCGSARLKWFGDELHCNEDYCDELLATRAEVAS